MEQSFFESLFSKKIKSKSNAQKILKMSFGTCSIPIIFTIFIHTFFPDIFSEVIANDNATTTIVYVIGLIMFGLGWFIFKKATWAAYAAIIVFIGPNIIDAIISESFPSISLFDMWLIVFAVASIRSIKCLKQESAE